jgi:hypothetical protein
VSARAWQAAEDVRRRVLNFRPVDPPPPPRRGPSPEQQAAQARFVALMTATRELHQAGWVLWDEIFASGDWWEPTTWAQRYAIDAFKRALDGIEENGS